ncbi:hypothetical protein TrRE_jg10763 [Triparma retinervis]|uniref:Uncharacterized protein n=1 Tax=Triparma retinervis TaxID=2557542 RepID=A0A9W6ZM26_9STRA|nr:hypothetical protein TrRE_jg10763 [Triparma retinervis]
MSQNEHFAASGASSAQNPDPSSTTLKEEEIVINAADNDGMDVDGEDVSKSGSDVGGPAADGGVATMPMETDAEGEKGAASTGEVAAPAVAQGDAPLDSAPSPAVPLSPPEPSLPPPFVPVASKIAPYNPPSTNIPGQTRLYLSQLRYFSSLFAARINGLEPPKEACPSLVEDGVLGVDTTSVKEVESYNSTGLGRQFLQLRHSVLTSVYATGLYADKEELDWCNKEKYTMHLKTMGKRGKNANKVFQVVGRKGGGVQPWFGYSISPSFMHAEALAQLRLYTSMLRLIPVHTPGVLAGIAEKIVQYCQSRFPGREDYAFPINVAAMKVGDGLREAEAEVEVQRKKVGGKRGGKKGASKQAGAATQSAAKASGSQAGKSAQPPSPLVAIATTSAPTPEDAQVPPPSSPRSGKVVIAVPPPTKPLNFPSSPSSATHMVPVAAEAATSSASTEDASAMDTTPRPEEASVEKEEGKVSIDTKIKTSPKSPPSAHPSVTVAQLNDAVDRMLNEKFVSTDESWAAMMNYPEKLKELDKVSMELVRSKVGEHLLLKELVKRTDKDGNWEDPSRPALGYTPGMGAGDLLAKAKQNLDLAKGLMLHPVVSHQNTPMFGGQAVGSPRGSHKKRKNSTLFNQLGMDTDKWGTNGKTAKGMVANDFHTIAPLPPTKVPYYGRGRANKRSKGSVKDMDGEEMEGVEHAESFTSSIQWGDIASQFTSVDAQEVGEVELAGEKNIVIKGKSQLLAPTFRSIVGTKDDPEGGGVDGEEEGDFEDLSDEAVLKRHTEVLERMKAKIDAIREARLHKQQGAQRANQHAAAAAHGRKL